MFFLFFFYVFCFFCSYNEVSVVLDPIDFHCMGKTLKNILQKVLCVFHRRKSHTALE